METTYNSSQSRLADLLAGPVFGSRFVKGSIPGPDGRPYFETSTPDSPVREWWEGGDLVLRLTTSDGHHWEVRPGDDVPRPEDWIPID